MDERPKLSEMTEDDYRLMLASMMVTIREMAIEYGARNFGAERTREGVVTTRIALTCSAGTFVLDFAGFSAKDAEVGVQILHTIMEQEVPSIPQQIREVVDAMNESNKLDPRTLQ